MKTIFQINYFYTGLFLFVTGVLLSCANPVNKVIRNIDPGAKDTLLSYRFRTDDSLCTSWKIEKERILNLISAMQPINDSVRLQCYAYYDCQIQGVVRLSDTLYEYTINAGGWAVLTHEKQIKILGAGKKDSLDFVSVYYCDEDWGL